MGRTTSFLILSMLMTLSVYIRLEPVMSPPTYYRFNHLIPLLNAAAHQQSNSSVTPFVPLIAWPDNNNNGIYFYERLSDINGNNYFISYPPLFFILSSSILQYMPPSIHSISLHILALLTHLCIALLAFFLAKKLFTHSFPPLIAASVVLFFPPLLNLGIEFFPELGALFFLMLLINIVIRQQQISKKNQILLFVIACLFMLTEWMALFMLCGLFVYVRIVNRQWKYILWPVATGVLTGIVLIIVNLLSIAGPEKVTHALMIRFVERSGWFSQQLSDGGLNLFNAASWRLAFEQIHQALSGIGYLVGLLAILILFAVTKKKIYQLSMWAFLLFLPVLMHSVIFFNSTIIHFSNIGKWALPIAFAGAYLTEYIQTHYKKIQQWFITAFVLASILSVFSFLNYIDSKDAERKQLESMQLFIETYKNSTQPLIVKYNDASINQILYLEYVCGRNLGVAIDENAALHLIQKKNSNCCVFITFDKQNNDHTAKTLCIK